MMLMNFSLLMFLCLYVIFNQVEPKLVKTATAKQDCIESHVSLFGIIHAKKEATLHAEVSGTIEKILIPSGSQAENNQLLAFLKHDTTRLSLELLHASTKLSKERFNRLRGLDKFGFSSRAELEKAQREIIEAEIAAIKASRELEQRLLIMPFNGIIGLYKVKEGSVVKAGDEIISVYDPQDLFIDINIPEKLLPLIQVGQKVTIENQKSQIASVEKILDPHTRMGTARIDFKGKENVIGASVIVDILLAQKEKTITIPKQAIFQYEGQPHAYKIQNDKAYLTKITIGLESKEKIEILEGLKEGDIVILEDQNTVYNKSYIKFSHNNLL